VPTNVTSPACDKDALCVAINLEIPFFSRFERTLSGSEVALAELGASRFIMLRVGTRVG
jgi:hypothetical protein